MPSEARQKKIMEKLNRAQKCSILGPQNLGSRGGLGPRGPPGSAPVPVGCILRRMGLLLGGWGGIPACTEADSLCEQNHTRLWKYNLAPTSLRAVINQHSSVFDLYLHNYVANGQWGMVLHISLFTQTHNVYNLWWEVQKETQKCQIC